jgi:hypothetical protein
LAGHPAGFQDVCTNVEVVCNELRVFACRGENSVGLNVAGMIAALRPMDFSDRTWCGGQ